MRAGPAVMTAILAVVLSAGCGETGSDRASTVDQPAAAGTVQEEREVPARRYSSEQIKGALLTVADLPTGWSVKPDNGSSGKQDSHEYAQCPKFAAVVKQVSDVDNITADFTSPAGSRLNEGIMSLGEADAGKLMADYSDAVSACPKLASRTRDGVAFDMYLTALSFPKLADETFAVRATATVHSTTVNMDMVLVRHRGVIVSIVQTSTAVIDTMTTEEVARLAVAKAGKILA